MCLCVREQKLPLLELQFLKNQREKTEEQGAMMISPVSDMKETARQEKYLARKELEKQRNDLKEQQLNQAPEEVVLEENDHQINEDTGTDTGMNDLKDFLKKRNTVEIKSLASTAIRYGTSSRTAGALATAYLGNLIKGGVLPPEASYLAVDGAKVQRAKEKMM